MMETRAEKRPYGKRERLRRRGALAEKAQLGRRKALAVYRVKKTRRTFGERVRNYLLGVTARIVAWKIERDTRIATFERDLTPMRLDDWLAIMKSGPKMNWSATA